MIKKINLLLLTILILSCQSIKQSYQKEQELPKPVKIAILLPMSGEYGQMGRRINQFINFGFRDGAAKNIESVTYDISDQENIDQIIDKVMLNKPDLILGPIFSNDTLKVALRAKQINTITISLSNNPMIADTQVYIFGHAPLQQTRKLLQYLSSINIKNLVVLSPEGINTQNSIKILDKIAKDYGVQILANKHYSSNCCSIAESIADINTIIDEFNDDPDNLTKAGIYIADEGQILTNVFNELVKYQLDKKAIICGENKINIDYKQPIDLIFTGSLNIASSKLSLQVLKSIFDNTYVSVWDGLAYDLGLITSYAIGVGQFNKADFMTRFANPNGYIGVSGHLQIIDNVVKRRYDIIERTGACYKIIEQ